MRSPILTLTVCAAFGLSGCSQVSGWLKGDSPSDGQVVNADLRSTPDQSYEFSDGGYEVELYDTSTSYTTGSMSYAGYDVVLYDTAYGATHSSTTNSSTTNYVVADPREAEFVKLNGTSQNTDWQNCETSAQGYLFISEYDFSLDPNFEVCMRNKGYVLATEAGYFATNPISAKTAGLRGYTQPGYVQSSYSYP